MRYPPTAITGLPTRSDCCSPAAPTITAIPCTACRSEAPPCRPSAGSSWTRHGIDMPPPDSLVQIRKITKDYRSLRPLRIESLDPVSYTHLTLPTSDLV